MEIHPLPNPRLLKMFVKRLAFALLPLCLCGVEAALLQAPSDLPANTSYDYIIVGGELRCVLFF